MRANGLFFPWIHPIACSRGMHCVSLVVRDPSMEATLAVFNPVHFLFDTVSWDMPEVSGLRAALVPFSIGRGPTSCFLTAASLAFMWISTAFCF